MLHRRAAVIVAAVALLGAAACGGGEEAGGGGGAKTVGVTVKEWAVAPAQASVAAGSITFQVKNEGPNHVHEFVVVKTDLSPTALPTHADGSVNEEGSGFESIGEIEDIAVGTSPSTTFNLSAGKYVLFCNVVEDQPTADMGGQKSHYKLGMTASFTVT